MLCLLIDNLIEGYTFENNLFIIILFVNIFCIHLFPQITNLLKKTNDI